MSNTTTDRTRLVARWTHPRGRAFVDLRAHDEGAHPCYSVRAQGSAGVLYAADDAAAIAEVERRIGLGCYTPDAYKTGLVRSV